MQLINTATKRLTKPSSLQRLTPRITDTAVLFFSFDSFWVGVILTTLVRVGANMEQRHATQAGLKSIIRVSPSRLSSALKTVQMHFAKK